MNPLEDFTKVTEDILTRIREGMRTNSEYGKTGDKCPATDHYGYAVLTDHTCHTFVTHEKADSDHPMWLHIRNICRWRALGRSGDMVGWQPGRNTNMSFNIDAVLSFTSETLP